MRKDLEDFLYARHPKLLCALRERYPSDSIPTGIDCGDGWFPLIDTLCTSIQTRVDGEALPQIHVQRIKEKLGTLRFVIFAQGDERIRGMIDFAWALSARICEVCGAPGELRGTATACPVHSESRASDRP